ncbi:MAG: hypothetical protein V1743_04915 [Nanoarchaeota archaeon]
MKTQKRKLLAKYAPKYDTEMSRQFLTTVLPYFDPRKNGNLHDTDPKIYYSKLARKSPREIDSLVNDVLSFLGEPERTLERFRYIIGLADGRRHTYAETAETFSVPLKDVNMLDTLVMTTYYSIHLKSSRLHQAMK